MTQLFDGEFKTIYHLADIHIRPNDRIEEYRTVFEEVLRAIPADPNALVVVAGDTFDRKGVLHSEGFGLGWDFFTGLRKKARVVVIPGNHDAYVGSESDWIVKLAETTGVTYIRRSGVYVAGNIVFVHAGFVDPEVGWPEVGDSLVMPGGRKRLVVGLYHESVDGSTLPNGRLCRADGGGDSISSRLKGCDLALLGHIHKHQFITPTMAYAGSLIQQNFGEEVAGHGFIRWDITGAQPAGLFIEVKNPWKFVTIRDDSKLDGIDAKTTVRIMMTDGSAARMAADALSETRHPLAIKGVATSSLDVGSEQIHKGSGGCGDFMSAVAARGLCADTMKKLHDRFFVEAGGLFCDWRVKSLKFRGALSYAGEEFIDFSAAGIYSISGPNAAGKSNILRIIQHGIFGSGMGNPLVRLFVNTATEDSDYYIAVEIQSGSSVYEIRRGYRRGRAMATISKDGVAICTSAEASNDMVRQLFGDGQAFLRTNVYSAHSPQPLSSGPAVLYEMVEKMFALDSFVKAFAAARSEAMKLDTELVKNRAKVAVISDRTGGDEGFASAEVAEAAAAEANEAIEKCKSIIAVRESTSRAISSVMAITRGFSGQLSAAQPESKWPESVPFAEINSARDAYVAAESMMVAGDFTDDRDAESMEREIKTCRDKLNKLPTLDIGRIAALKAAIPEGFRPIGEKTDLVADISVVQRKRAAKLRPSKPRPACVSNLVDLVMKEVRRPVPVVKPTESRPTGTPVRRALFPIPKAVRHPDNLPAKPVSMTFRDLRKLSPSWPSDVPGCERKLGEMTAVVETLRRYENLPALIASIRGDSPTRSSLDSAAAILEDVSSGGSKLTKFFSTRAVCADIRLQIDDIKLNEEIVAHNTAVTAWQMEAAACNFDRVVHENESIAAENKLADLADKWAAFDSAEEAGRQADAAEKHNAIVADILLSREWAKWDADVAADAERDVHLSAAFFEIDRAAEIDVQRSLLQTRIERAGKHIAAIKTALSNDELRAKMKAASISLSSWAGRAEIHERKITSAIEKAKKVLGKCEAEKQKADLAIRAFSTKAELDVKVATLAAELSDLTAYMSLVAPTGIPKTLMSDRIVMMGEYATRITRMMSELEVKLVMGKGTADAKALTVSVRKAGSDITTNQLSGFETFLVNIAMKAAFIRFSMAGRGAILMIDEGLDVIDEKNFGHLEDILTILADELAHVLIISHRDGITDFADKVIRVKRGQTGSCLMTSN
jgi:hypothetical protein